MARSRSTSRDPPEQSRHWDFSSVFTFLDAYSSATVPNEIAPANTGPIAHLTNTIFIPKALGDFSKLWEHFGKTVDIEPPVIAFDTPSNSSILISSDAYDSTSTTIASTPPSSAADDLDIDSEIVKSKPKVQWIEEVKPVKTLRKTKAPTQADKRREVINALVGNDDLPLSKSPHKPTTTISRIRSTSKSKSLQSSDSEGDHLPRPCIVSKGLYITDNGPPPPSRKLLPSHVDPYIVQPVFTLTRSEQTTKLVGKLQRDLGMIQVEDWQFRDVKNEGIHVFVDASNIVISFFERLKKVRGLHPTTHVKNAPFNFRGLSIVMERFRPVARRILVGSKSSSLYHDDVKSKQPSYVGVAESCGYEVNMLERVSKQRIVGKRKVNSGHGYATSGYSSGSDTRQSAPRVMAEQGVDELLHLKISDSLLDATVPSTIVLATGDAAEAEYSGGFLQYVERALLRGWKVELVAWSDSISQEYKSYEFRKRWANDFTIIELDSYLEEMLAIYAVEHS